MIFIGKGTQLWPQRHRSDTLFGSCCSFHALYFVTIQKMVCHCCLPCSNGSNGSGFNGDGDGDGDVNININIIRVISSFHTNSVGFPNERFGLVG